MRAEGLLICQGVDLFMRLGELPTSDSKGRYGCVHNMSRGGQA